MRRYHRYRLYGLTLDSPLRLPCPRADDGPPADVILAAGTEREFAPVRRGTTAAHTLDHWFWSRRLDDGTRYLRWAGLFEFLVSADGRRIRYRRLEGGTPEAFRVYLLGPVLSFSLLALGVEPLHGTATVIDGEAVVFLGACGRGKSTLAAALLARGCPVLTDDVVAVAGRKGRPAVHAGIPRLKLFHAVARRLLGRGAGAPRMPAQTSKLVLPLANGEACRAAVPLRAVYALAEPEAAEDPGVRVDPLAPPEAFFELVGAAFNLVVLDRQRLTNQFRFVSELVGSVPVRRLVYPRRFSSLPAVCDALLADVGPGGAAAAHTGAAAGSATA